MSDWKYKWNDQEVDAETFVELEKEHKQWVDDLQKKTEEQLKKQKEDDKKLKVKRK